MDRTVEYYDWGSFWADYYGKEDYKSARVLSLVNGRVFMSSCIDVLERGSLVSPSSMYGNRMKRRLHVLFKDAVDKSFFYFDTLRD